MLKVDTMFTSLRNKFRWIAISRIVSFLVRLFSPCEIIVTSLEESENILHNRFFKHCSIIRRSSNFVCKCSNSFDSCVIANFFTVEVEYSYKDFCFPVGFPSLSLILISIGLLSSSSRSIHIGSFWIVARRVSRRVIRGLICEKKVMECSLWELIFLWDRNVLFVTRMLNIFDKSFLLPYYRSALERVNSILWVM